MEWIYAFGDFLSSAQDSRWLYMGRWASQQRTEQNANEVLCRLQVDTLHTQYVVRNAIGFLQVLQFFQALMMQ